MAVILQADVLPVTQQMKKETHTNLMNVMSIDAGLGGFMHVQRGLQ